MAINFVKLEQGQLDIPSLIPTNKIKFKREHKHNKNLKKL